MENNTQEDLDLLFVLKSIKKGILNLFRGIIWLIEFSTKHILALVVFMAIAISISLGFYYLKKPYYTSALSIAHIRFDNDYCYEMITNLNSYINVNNNNKELAEKLSIGINYAKEIKDIKYKTLNNIIARRYADSMSVMLPFLVEVEVYDNEILDTLQKGILSYLEANEYATKRKLLEKESLDKIEQRMHAEIREMDSLKKIVSQSIIPRSTGNGIILGEPIDPVAVYKKAMESYEKLLMINRKQVLNNSFEITIGFAKSSKIAGLGKLWYYLIGSLVGYTIGILFLVRKRNRKPAA
jgi:hypothetical protein